MLALATLTALAFGLVACGDDGETNAQPTAASTTAPTSADVPDLPSGSGPPPVEGEPAVLDSGVQIIDISAGDGTEAQAGDTVTVNYTGWLEDGTEFDSGSLTQPLGGLIAGWQEGVPGMRVGGTRRVIIPPELGYGEGGFGTTIPPNATLIFDIELLSIP
jgi:FKBP-type peptidyl-prolyl cis-trans isomerase